MGAPAYTKGPWTFSVNNNCSEATLNETCQHVLYQIKESLASFSAWSVVASCDSTAVKNIGDASPDLWTDWTTDIIAGNPGVAHSWIILENSVTGEQFCIDVNVTSVYYRADWIYSATGAFNADGTTTNRPTDSESQIVQTRSFNWLNTNTDGAVVNAMICDDDSITRFFVLQRDGANYGGFFMGFEELANTPSAWTGTYKRAVFNFINNVNLSATPFAQDPQIIRYDGTTALGYIYQKDATPYEGWNTVFYTGESYHQFATGTGNSLSSINVDAEWGEGYPVTPIGLYRDVVTRGGAMGTFQDIYWSHFVHDMLDTYPASGARTWIKWGCFMVPWNGSTPLDVP